MIKYYYIIYFAAIIYILIIKSYSTWSYKYENNYIHTIRNLLFIGYFYITIPDVLPLAFISNIVSVVFIIQLIITSFFALIRTFYLLFNKRFLIVKRKFNLFRNLFILIFCSYLILAFNLHKQNIWNNIKSFFLDHFFIVIRTKSRRNVNNTLILLKYIHTVPRHSNWKKKNKIKCIYEIICIAVEFEFLWLYKKIDDSL